MSQLCDQLGITCAVRNRIVLIAGVQHTNKDRQTGMQTQTRGMVKDVI